MFEFILFNALNLSRLNAPVAWEIYEISCSHTCTLIMIEAEAKPPQLFSQLKQKFVKAPKRLECILVHDTFLCNEP